jgi:CubicO group peptidase (beta-lactamase class C family)
VRNLESRLRSARDQRGASMRRRDFLTRTLLAPALGSLLPRPVSAGQSIAGDPGPSGHLPRLVTALERHLPDWMSGAAVPGLGIAVVERGRVAWSRGFGVKDASLNTRVDKTTMFEAASMSKPVFAYVVMKLVELGVLSLDVPLTTYASSRFLEGDSRLQLMTARHVLSHTGGFQNWRSEKAPLAIHFTPGSRHMYSGEGYNYLQTVTTQLLGEPFEAYMTKRLLKPFGMASSRYVWNDQAARLMARPHDATGTAVERARSTESNVARYGSAGALLSTPVDYAKFLIEVISPRPADAVRLKPESVREMLRPSVKLDKSEPPSSWALGWQIFHGPGRDFIYHGGDNRGFHCAAVGSVAGQSGYVAMTNGDGGVSVLRSILTLDVMQEFLSA